jgi:hypothetical protein
LPTIITCSDTSARAIILLDYTLAHALVSTPLGNKGLANLGQEFSQPGAQPITKKEISMQPKNTTGRKKAAHKPTIKQRAQTIVDSDAYDNDTRESIRFHLETNDSELAEFVRRAEQGETICDTLPLEVEEYRHEDECKKAAQYVIAAYEVKGIPDFLTDAMMVALNKAAEIKGVTIWKDTEDGVAEEFDATGLADLFSGAQTLSLDIDDKERVLRATSELLHNPKTPQNLFEAVAEFVCEQSNVGENIYHSTPVLIEVLKSVPPEELRGAILEARQSGAITGEEVSS